MNTAAINALIAGASEAPAPLWISRYVDAVKVVLEANMPSGLRIMMMPAKVEQVDIGTYDGVVVIHYRGSKYAKAAGPMGMVGHQIRTVDIDVHVIVRGLEGKAGAYDTIEQARMALQGRSLEGAQPIEIVDDGMITQSDGVWNYALSIRAVAPAVTNRADQRTIINRMEPS